MLNFTSLQVEAASRPAPESHYSAWDNHFAKAEGLSLYEAQQLAAWLKEAGYVSIEIQQQATAWSVWWTK